MPFRHFGAKLNGQALDHTLHDPTPAMNLFILSTDPKECAEYMIDKHVVKIILEAVQMLSTAIQLVDPEMAALVPVSLYKISHRNHPVSVWVRESLDNYLWTLALVRAMHEEWKYRYGHPA